MLVVEDQEDSLLPLCRLLKLDGHHVESVTTAREARYLTDAERYDLLLIDLGLPDISGLDLMRQLKQQYNLRAIAVSGHSDINEAELADAGFVRMLSKPLGYDTVKTAIEEFNSSYIRSPLGAEGCEPHRDLR